jgi:phosphoglycerate transport regulatory protein PgtC
MIRNRVMIILNRWHRWGRCRRRHALRLTLAGLAAVLLGSAAASDKVVVLTSYAQPFTARFQAEFERLYPGKRMEVLWRQSSDALAYLQSRRGEVDIYWSPAPGNFALLAQEGRLARLSLDHKELPDQIGGSAISDPNGGFAAFELAGHGIVYNKDALHRLGLPVPVDWPDLTHPAYAGQVQIPIPGRIGFAPVLIETVLQAYGWEIGWALLNEIAGNADFGGAADNRPGADEVVSGAKAARMTIDFFAATVMSNSLSIGFVYPRKTAYNPAHVAVFADAPNPDAARLFVDFVLSEQGQALLLHPDVRRLPVRQAMYDDHPELPARPFAADSMGYDGHLSRARQGLIAALFEAALVRRHTELASVWAQLHRAEAAGLRQHAAVRKARTLLTAAPIGDASQADDGLRARFSHAPFVRETAQQDQTSNDRAQVLADWDETLQARIAAARRELHMAQH